MARCDVCGNDYDKAFQVMSGRATYTFDCFECAIHKLAPVCAHCGCRVDRPRRRSAGSHLLLRDCARMTGPHVVADRA